MFYVSACLALYLSHVVPSAPGLRSRLIALAGPSTFRILYSLVSIVTIVWFVMAYRISEPGVQLYTPPGEVVWLALLWLPIAFFFMAARLFTPYGEIVKPEPARGIYRITRFPGSWGVLVWALIHVAATGDARRVVAFGTFTLIALTALLKNEYVMSRARGPEAAAFREETSFVPFAAILAGRQRLDVAEIGWKLPLASFLLFIVLLMLHPILMGVDPLALLP